MARHRRDLAKERFWRQHLASWRRCGSGVRAYCRTEGLPEASFYAWRRVLTKRRQPAGTRPSQPGTAAFVPVRLIEEPSADATLEIVLRGGRVVRVRPGFHAETLRKVVSVLEGLSC